MQLFIYTDTSYIDILPKNKKIISLYYNYIRKIFQRNIWYNIYKINQIIAIIIIALRLKKNDEKYH